MEKLKEQQDKFNNPTSGCAMFSVQLLPKDKEEELCEYCDMPLKECTGYKCWIR